SNSKDPGGAEQDTLSEAGLVALLVFLGAFAIAFHRRLSNASTDQPLRLFCVSVRMGAMPGGSRVKPPKANSPELTGMRPRDHYREVGTVPVWSTGKNQGGNAYPANGWRRKCWFPVQLQWRLRRPS